MTRTELEQLADEALAELSASDPIAEEVLLLRYKEPVKSKAGVYFMLGADKDDIIQEGMIGLIKAIQTYDPSKGAAFRTFADLCITRQILTAIKNASRRKYAPLNEAVSLSDPVSAEANAPSMLETLTPDYEDDPLEIVVMRDLAELVMSSKTGYLSDFEDQVLKYLTEGKNYREIAEIMAISPKQADNAVQRVRRKLNIFLEN